MEVVNIHLLNTPWNDLFHFLIVVNKIKFKINWAQNMNWEKRLRESSGLQAAHFLISRHVYRIEAGQ